ncbi:MAG: glycosyltransferase family 4 protein [Bryobacteraceae bacterium]|nr:glycosyltransferase family 4 protein [Bryobacteraceae bacterium]
MYLIPGEVGGTEVYLRSLVEAMEGLESGHEIVVFTNRETGALGREARALEVSAASRPARILFEQVQLPGVLKRAGIDVVLNPGFTAPYAPGRPQVTVFHDLQHKRHPEYFRWFDLPAWNLLLGMAARRSERLIAVSPATRDDLLKFYPFLDAGRIDVVPHGVDPAFFDLAARREAGDFLLCPSTTHPHKNHARLLRCFAKLREKRPQIRLILTGVKGFVHDDVARLAVTLGKAVEVRGWVERSELLELFRTARAVVYPSTFEGFGMPVAEAMAAGVPLACSDIEPLRTLAQGAAVLFDPESDEALLSAMEQVTDGHAPAARLAASLTWRHAAEATVESLMRAARR